jgi:hypothetical protein
MARQLVLLAFALLAFSSAATAKDAGDLLKQYIENPNETAKNEVLALVEIVSIDIDVPPEENWKQTGTLHLKLIEAVGGKIPQELVVRFKKRQSEGEDAWTWDYVTLKSGKRLLGFFNRWNDKWAVRQDGRTNVINNPENISEDLIKRVQPMFKTVLQSKTDTTQNKVPEDTVRKLDDPQR